MARHLLIALTLALAAALLPAQARAQGQNTCELVYQRGDWRSVGDPANRVISADGPLLVRCAAGEELRSDSAVIYQNINEVHLFGQVDYQDPTRSLTSDRATYNSQTGRLYATGNVVFTDKNRGSTLRGPELEYFRAGPGRPEPQAIATQRPHLTIVPKDRGDGKRRDPMEVDGDRITSVGERFVTAEGNVVMVSRDSRSTAAEAFYDADAERLELRRNAQVDGEDYDLTGDYIESQLADGQLQRILSRTDARLVSERLTVTGPQLQLFFERDLLQRLVSGQEQGKEAGRSVAVAKGFRMEADSIEALSPEQKLRTVTAIGTAKGESWDTAAVATAPIPVAGDSAGADSAAAPRDTATVRTVANVPRAMTEPPAALAEKDLLLADTIIGYFREDSAAADSTAADSAGAPRVLGTPVQRDTAGRDTAETELERLVAIGNARSVYRVRDDSVKAGQKRQAINYLNGDHIDLTFKEGEVDQARVRGLKRGVYLDPRAPGDTTRTDSAAARTNGPAGNRPGTATPATGQRQPATGRALPGTRPLPAGRGTAPRGTTPRTTPPQTPANPPRTPPSQQQQASPPQPQSTAPTTGGRR